WLVPIIGQEKLTQSLWLVALIIGAFSVLGCGGEEAPGPDPCAFCYGTCADGICIPFDTTTNDGGSDVREEDTTDATVDIEVEGPCEVDGDCASNRYCHSSGECRVGCRTSPDNCEDDLQCSPASRVCVGGCVSDDECEEDQYCDLVSDPNNPQCEVGCRTSPDNCPTAPIGQPEIFCDASLRACFGGSCESDDECLLGFFCNTSFELCEQGCRSDGSGCELGEACDVETNECQQLTCECGESDDNQSCDAQCNISGSPSSLYCNRDLEVCEFGCRIRNDGSDTCGPNAYCADETHVCETGCGSDANCPYGTYCDLDLVNPVCVEGCKQGECGGSSFCCLGDNCCGDHECCTTGCSEDSDCFVESEFAGLVCRNDFCTEGCLIDDPETTGVNEDSCADAGFVCDPNRRQCVVDECDENEECPLGQYCTQGLCFPGCDDDVSRCPVGQICSELSGLCGCAGDSECPVNTHCTSPVCENDCIADNPDTPSVDEDNCTNPLACNPFTGRCTAGCVDRAETDSSRNDTPTTATCMILSETDLSHPQRGEVLCKRATDPRPPTSNCDGQDNTYCVEATGCVGGDFDWYV
ncbi:MAG: hypothetical protein KC561_16260, partial [Myxococcales bacterium]|nr:hypothetical protein [Myxococcales bacterium]